MHKIENMEDCIVEIAIYSLDNKEITFYNKHIKIKKYNTTLDDLGSINRLHEYCTKIEVSKENSISMPIEWFFEKNKTEKKDIKYIIYYIKENHYLEDIDFDFRIKKIMNYERNKILQ